MQGGRLTARFSKHFSFWWLRLTERLQLAVTESFVLLVY